MPFSHKHFFVSPKSIEKEKLIRHLVEKHDMTEEFVKELNEGQLGAVHQIRHSPIYKGRK